MKAHGVLGLDGGAAGDSGGDGAMLGLRFGAPVRPRIQHFGLAGQPGRDA